LVEEVGKHEKMPDIYRCQSGCGPWPCDASRLATALEASLAREEGLRLALAGLVDAEWMVTHDWGGDREAVLKVAREALASTGGGE
jgi:hypothetical protein